MNLAEICDYLILAGAVIVAIKHIYGFFKTPVDNIKETAKSNEEEHIKEVLQSEMPGLLEKNCTVIIASLNEIKEMTLNQEEQLHKLQDSVNLIKEAQLDTMRYDMNAIYYKYRPYKKILSADKKAFIKFYEDYHSMGGNTWIDALHADVVKWETIEDESELKN